MDEYQDQVVNESTTVEQVEVPKNYFSGFIGAAIGGIVGAILTIILYFFGFVSAFSAWIAIAIGAALYKKFGGKEDKVMVAIVGITSVVFCLLAVWVIYLFASVTILANLGIENLGLVPSFMKCMNEVEGFSGDFAKDMLMNLGFSILGVIFVVSRMAKKVKANQNV